MSTMDLSRLLKSVGQSTFVTHYRQFADESLSNVEVADLLPKDLTEKSRRSRTTHARDIFSRGLEMEALEVIAASTRAGNEQTAEDARNLLADMR